MLLNAIHYDLAFVLCCLKHNSVSNQEVTSHSEMVQKSCTCLVANNDVWVFTLILQQPFITLLNYKLHMSFWSNIFYLEKYLNGQNQT